MLKPPALQPGDRMAVVSLSAGTLGEETAHHQLRRGLQRLRDFGLQPVTMPNAWHYTQQPVLSGRLMGGNLNTMYGLFKSQYYPELQTGDLLFIEDAEKDAATLEKNFVMLQLAGVFQRVAGVILGKHALFDDAGTHRRPVDILLEVLNGQPLPIIYDYDSCHTVPMISTPLGSHVQIDAERRTITFQDF